MTDLAAALLTGHARDQLAQRNIDEADVRAVLAAPDHVETLRPGQWWCRSGFLSKPRREAISCGSSLILIGTRPRSLPPTARRALPGIGASHERDLRSDH